MITGCIGLCASGRRAHRDMCQVSRFLSEISKFYKAMYAMYPPICFFAKFQNFKIHNVLDIKPIFLKLSLLILTLIFQASRSGSF
jgi:hypothetical protein